MFDRLNELGGAALLVAVVGLAGVWALNGFWEFGSTWYQGLEDMERSRHQAEQRHCYGIIDGKYCYSEDEWDAHRQQWFEQQARSHEDFRRSLRGPDHLNLFDDRD